MKILTSLCVILLLSLFALGCCSTKNWTIRWAIKEALDRNVVVFDGLTPICSGFIVRQDAVITAGHCLQNNPQNLNVEGESVQQAFGVEGVDVILFKVKTKRVSPVLVSYNLKLGDDVLMVGGIGTKRNFLSMGYIAHITADRIGTSFFGAPGSSGSGVVNEYGQYLGAHTQTDFIVVMDGTVFRTNGTFIPAGKFKKLLEVPEIPILLNGEDK